MARYSNPKEEKDDSIDPIWQGLGLLIIVILSVGGFLLAQQLIKMNQATPFLPFRTPTGFMTELGPIKVPGTIALPLMFMVILDIIAYSFMTIIYAVANPKKKDPTDAEWAGRK